jgi:DNA modification methylase
MTDLQERRCPPCSRNIILQGHVLDRLRQIPGASIDCVVTSPPFWRLRTYAGQQKVVWDGRPECDHKWREQASCPDCGAWYGALGLEPTPYMYVRHLLQIFREVRRVLHPNGTAWLVLGDTYWRHSAPLFLGQTSVRASNSKEVKPACEKRVLKEGDLVGIPWMVALALRADGWYLRNDIVREKTNGLPESVRSRLTRSHEYVFMLSKSRCHYFDAYSISEPCVQLRRSKVSNSSSTKRSCCRRNKRSVWRLATEPFGYEMCRACGRIYDSTEYRRLAKIEDERKCSCGAMEWLSHSATMPVKLAEACILAGCARWVCMKCGKPRERLVRRKTVDMGRRFADRTADEVHASHTSALRYKQKRIQSIPIGWSNCGCGAGFRNGVVLDPFMGSGTVAVAARSLKRDWLGIELSVEYIKLANERLRREMWQGSPIRLHSCHGRCGALSSIPNSV